MPDKIAIIISPNWKTYAEKYLSDCIESIRNQTYAGRMEIFIPDNESTDASYGLLKEKAPEAKILRFAENAGFAKPNNEAMRMALEEECTHIVLLNMDTIAEPTLIEELVRTADSDERIGAVQARIMLWPEKEKINSIGNVTHFLGFGYCRGYNEEISGYQLSGAMDICYPSGAGVLFKSETLKTVGLFDEEYWMYNEDQDLGWRIWLAGFRCVLAPNAVVYHKYEFGRTGEKYYWVDRNRILSMLYNYHWLTLLLVTPACLVMEFGLLMFSMKGGWLKEKLRVYRYFASPGNWWRILRRRKTVQSLRRVREREIVRMFSGRIWYEEIADYRLRFVNPLFNAYWTIVNRLILW